MYVHEQLLMHGIKPSLQRIAIMNYLLEHHTHPTAEEIYIALFSFIPTLSKTTVYNTLKLFAEQGVVNMLTIDEKNVCFDADISPHAHFLCKKCGKIHDVEIKEAVKEIGNFTHTAAGHEITEMHYYYKGICINCL
ncbi:Peroxide-responsive repressor PerR [termite gut metagenome]|uniref:Peroxide-responsive repressor PerR n=1 Tax=termite gut metagenome TaxID=433724 RepID=A0A5J4SN00_9ZZZZ